MGTVNTEGTLPLDDVSIPKEIQHLAVILNERDNHTNQHCSRVSGLSAELGNALGLDGHARSVLAASAQLHDIGKIGIPDAVLLKPGPLTEDEWAIMKLHPEKGERIIASLQQPAHAEISKIIRHHHEAFDGSGYPDALSGEDIPILCRVLLVVDVYDAMATRRPYHSPISHTHIMTLLDTEEGKKVDPYVLNRFRKIIGESIYRAH
jgi:response regulator RpfG family c-di-GMP phosphodiesterase